MILQNMNSTFNPYIALPFWILFGLICAYLANKRGRNPYAWFGIGLFLGVFGILLLVVIPKKNQIKEEIVHLAPPVKTEPEVLYYYLDENHKQKGPVNLSFLKYEFQNKRINSSTYVWTESMDDWKKIENLGEIQDFLNS